MRDESAEPFARKQPGEEKKKHDDDLLQSFLLNPGDMQGKVHLVDLKSNNW